MDRMLMERLSLTLRFRGLWPCLLAAALFSGMTASHGQERKLEAAEITALLSGRAALGENRGLVFASHYDRWPRTQVLARTRFF
ncbi:hypothetical protein [Denitrobaculum tricleocarpae]|uniref:Uncharacterized protein n=1 Tax=Denitrobaculum tricleocarpae TaxID=2591009 RepID=A0A545T0A5_9PROT|nr:hypothetical protein [Denitrobaculum tricleocarpae]TQV70655.1 hypothetical protein FKG95_27755 [Denitrobaculum tricleocarpae]